MYILLHDFTISKIFLAQEISKFKPAIIPVMLVFIMCMSIILNSHPGLI